MSAADCAALRPAIALAFLFAHIETRGAEGTPPAPQDAPAPAYVDRVIDSSSLQADIDEDAGATYDPSGAPRTLLVDSRLQSSSNAQGEDVAAWVTLRGTLDTANYGAFSLDGSLRLYERSTQQLQGAGASFTLHQNAMPFGGGWAASQGLGVIQTLSPWLTAQQTSFFLPTRLIQGASTLWRNEASGIAAQLSGGQTGSFASIAQGSFYTSGNRVATLGIDLLPGRGGQSSLLPAGWSYSAMASGASGSAGQVVPGYGQTVAEPAGSGLMQSLRWEAPDKLVQGNVLSSRNQDPSLGPQPLEAPEVSHLGAWIDGAVQAADVTHRWGLNYLPPGMAWQGSALGGNSQGGYYRWSQVGLRTQVEAQVSTLRPVDPAAGGIKLNQAGASISRRIDQQLGVGGVIQVSGGTTDSVQVSGYSELHRPWADMRLLAGLETSDGQIVLRRLSADQAWLQLPSEMRLSTSLALNSTSAGAQSTSGAPLINYGTSVQLGITGGVDVSDRLALGLNAQASLPVSVQAARIYNVNASLQWRLTPGWSLAGALALSQSSGLKSPTTASPIPGLPGTFAPYAYPAASSHDLWLTLRYDFAAGSAVVPIGGRSGAGGGTIVGTVYLDDNRNGRHDAIEARATNVSVMLDGRYATRTDAQGHFEFPFVAPGPHTVQVVAETLPLPWMMPAGEVSRVEVTPRETIRLEIGAARDRASSGAE
jgi:hypothetical protein